jgi:tRNA-dihydrouridine synthase B
MRIGPIELSGRVFLAPLAGYTDSVFRGMCKDMGAALVTTEMVSADGLVRGSDKTLRYLEFSESERPVGIQLFGSDPAVMREAASIVVEQHRPDVVDINYGCPVRKVVNRNAGSALLKDLPLLEAVTRAVVEGAGSTPVTAKTRCGWDNAADRVGEIGRVLEGAGVRAIALHARSRSDRFSGRADWSAIGRLKSAVRLPVIGNGDVTDPRAARRLLDETGCDAVMIGRGAIGNPWIFARTERYLSAGELPPEPSPFERIDQCLVHFTRLVALKGETVAVNEMRKHVACYTRGLTGAGEIRRAANTARNAEELVAILRAFRQKAAQGGVRAADAVAVGDVPET